MKRTIGILMFVAAFTLVSLSAYAKRTGPEQIDMSGKQKEKISFSHRAHENSIADCTTCHHMGVGTGTCKDCHGKDARFPDVQTAMHKSCQGCHASMKISDPADCTFCHGGKTNKKDRKDKD